MVEKWELRITSIDLKKSENKSKITMRMLEAVTALKKISRRKYVLMTGNATTSLYLALKSLNLKPKSNVLGWDSILHKSYKLLISNDPQQAYQIAIDLERSNKERQSIEVLLSEQINSEVKKFHNHPVLVLSGNQWHEGIIGIVASRIKDKYNKPTVLISLNNKVGKGSARSVVGFDIGSLIIKAVQSGVLEKGGGHKMAGGFTLKEEKIPIFRNFLIKNFEAIEDFSSVV